MATCPHSTGALNDLGSICSSRVCVDERTPAISIVCLQRTPVAQETNSTIKRRDVLKDKRQGTHKSAKGLSTELTNFPEEAS
jgi:hypothetical protein